MLLPCYIFESAVCCIFSPFFFCPVHLLLTLSGVKLVAMHGSGSGTFSAASPHSFTMERTTALGRQALIQLGHGFNLCLLLSLQSSPKLSTNSLKLSCHLESLRLKMVFHVQDPRVPGATFLCSILELVYPSCFLKTCHSPAVFIIFYSFETYSRGKSDHNNK